MRPLQLILLKDRLAELTLRKPSMQTAIIEHGRWQLEMCELQLEIAKALLGD